MPDFNFRNLYAGDVLFLQPIGNNDVLHEDVVCSVKRKYVYVDLPWKKSIAGELGERGMITMPT